MRAVRGAGMAALRPGVVAAAAALRAWCAAAVLFAAAAAATSAAQFQVRSHAGVAAGRLLVGHWVTSNRCSADAADTF